MKYLIAFLLLVSPVLAAEPGFYRAYDGVFMGTGTGFGTEFDVFRDVGLDVVELTTLDMPGWYVYNATLSATVTGAWSGGWSYQNDPIPVGTVEISGTWDTDDLGGRRVDHLSIFKARAPMVDRTCIQTPEPSCAILVIVGVVLIFGGLILMNRGGQ